VTLPFLKHEKEAGSASSDSDGEDYSMLDAIAEDIMSALEKSSKSMLKEALAALLEHIKEEDTKQDAEMAKGTTK
jgi:rhamnogalacturonyl hydrolase YesR